MASSMAAATLRVLTEPDRFLSFPDTGVMDGQSDPRTALRGYGDLVRELGGDPASFLARFGIPVGAEQQADGFVAVDAFIRLLEASAEDLKCPDFGLRLSRFQGLDILGPIAVIARNAQTVLGGFEAIARYLYVHSPALTLTVGRAAAPSPAWSSRTR